MDSDNEDYNENYDYSNITTVPAPRNNHIENNINEIINNVEREMLLKKSSANDVVQGDVTDLETYSTPVAGYVFFF